MSAPTTKQIEEYLQKIRRLPANKLCANCRVPSRLGFSAVCVKYQSFLCDMCKSSHQSYSHRTKSVTMSTWTIEEVRALDEKNGGGNEWCRAKWFARLSESDQAKYMPKEGDPLDKYKQFVHMAYEQNRWYDEDGKPEKSSSSAAATVETSQSAPSAATKRKAPAPAVKLAAAAPTKAAQPEEDLLILDFEAKVTTSSTPPIAIPSKPIATGAATNLMDDGEWGSFSESTAAPVAKPAASLSDDWTFQAAPPANPSPSFPAVMQPVFGIASSGSRPVQPAPSNGGFAFPAIQPQQPFSGFPPAAPLSNMPPVMMMGQQQSFQAPMAAAKPFMAGPPATSIPNDPFASLQSYSSAPSVMMPVKSSSGPMAVSSGLLRSTSNPNPNDPFAGLL